MKLTFFLSLMAFMQVSASFLAQKISLDKRNSSLSQTLNEIRDQSGYNIFYDAKLIKNVRISSIQLKDASIQEALDKCLLGQKLGYVIKQNTVIITPKIEEKTGQRAATAIRVTGLVVDTDKQPLIGVAVKVKGAKTGSMTGVDGRYAITVPDENAVLVFTYLGFATKEVVANKPVIDVIMTAAPTALNEVVAIGYATVRRKDLTGASASVSGEDLRIAPVTTAAQALTGKVAGVNIVTQSGAPGANYNITVRGGASITQSTEPLYIVDGFQMDNGLSNVDINDIASIDVLKDASSTAIYGARGSNGVVLITTKSGKAGKTELTYNTYFGFEGLSQKLPVLNALDYAKYQYEYQLLAGKQDQWAAYFGGDINAPDFYTGAAARINSQYSSAETIDWQDEVFGGHAVTQNHNVNITSGTEKTRFMLSYNNTGQNGILDKYGYSKNGLRFKLNHEVLKGFRSDFNVYVNSRRIDGGGSLGGTLKMSVLQPSTGGVKYTKDQLLFTDLSDEMKAINSQYDIYNPIITNDAVTNTGFTRQAVANAGLELDITKNLMFRTAGSYSWEQRRNDFWDDGRTQTAITNGGPYGSRNNFEKSAWQLTNTLNWKQDLNKHQLNLLLGQETLYEEALGLENTYYEFPEANFELDDVSLASNTKNRYNSNRGNFTLLSFFGRVAYNYKGKYIANFTLRSDGSSKFGTGNKWGMFPSASAAWRISEEGFMKDQKVFDNLKLRVGYGTSGNNNIKNYVYATSYVSGSYTINNLKYPTLVPNNMLGNSALVWEKIKSTNIGLDADFLKSRISVGLDWYNNISDDLLIENAIPASTGYPAQTQNIGSFRNRGFEAVLSTINVRKKDFRWNTNFNIAVNRSKVLKIYGKSDADYFTRNYGSRIDYMIKVGQPLGQFYGYKYDGIYTTDDFTQNANGTYSLKPEIARPKSNATGTGVKPGDLKYVTTAGENVNGSPVWSTADRVVIGNAQPKFQGGFTNTLNYKNFDLTVFMNFMVGNDVFNMNTQRFIGPYLPNQNQLGVTRDRFTLIDPNTGRETTDLARLAALNPQQYDKKAVWSLNARNSIAITDALDYYVEDGSFLRIGTVTMGYTIPKLISSKVKLKNARIYATVNNLYTFTKYKGYDPEVSSANDVDNTVLTMGVDNSAYPRVKTYVVGLNVSF
ncbi:TonB-dependent receptor [Desertivirga arenae]|uniref:TonB-dependent receptor n=1 Tax=Desertivirga arenae TaxID=2810309 RepID=UPI001A9572BB|nr:TonB-dependent receptor [Pedobacter sp. SYSU D00823]